MGRLQPSPYRGYHNRHTKNPYYVAWNQHHGLPNKYGLPNTINTNTPFSQGPPAGKGVDSTVDDAIRRPRILGRALFSPIFSIPPQVR